MSFRKSFLVSVAVLLGFAASAQAQVGVYGMVTGERVTGFTCLDPQHQCASNDGKERPYGATFGAYYDFKSYGPVRLGGDVRGAVLNTSKSAETYGTSSDFIRHYSALGGVRASIGTPIKLLRPYAEVAAGYAKYSNTNYTQVQGLIGLDLALFPVLDLRAIEFGAGELFGTANHSTQSIGAGVVFHFPR